MTLVELVAIVVVFVLLFSMVIPLQSIANSAAGTISCKDSLKKLMAACIAYQGDNGGFYPFATADSANKPDAWLGVIQTQTLQNYVPITVAVWGCPENKQLKQAMGRTYSYNYAYNFWAFARGMQLKNTTGFTNSMFKNEKNPGNTVVFQDGANTRNAPGIVHWSEQFMNPQAAKSSASVAHNNGAFVNAGFADGHVAELKAPEQTWNDRRANGGRFKEIFPDAAFWYHTNYITK